VFLDTKGYERVAKDLPNMLQISVSILCDKYKINGSVARRVLRDLLEKGQIKQCGDHHQAFTLYTGVKAKPAGTAAAAPAGKQ